MTTHNAPISQTARLYELLKDGRPHRTDEIVKAVYPSSNICFHCGRGDFKSLARVGGRINDLAEGRWSGKTRCQFIDIHGNLLGISKGDLKGWHDPENPKLYWYRMKVIPAENYIGTIVGSPVDDAIEAHLPTPPEWKCPRPGCTFDWKHTHTTWSEEKAAKPQSLFA
ncbi:MAG TPA: hypothetical protein VNJ52_05110 [Patescibacteria group bacterium]|nr:hypothetical protein [Patescibacteria group bacterium]